MHLYVVNFEQEDLVTESNLVPLHKKWKKNVTQN